jgi:hypothetical protein
MSVAIATGGLFRDCCGGGVVAGGGGAPPVHQYAEQYDDKESFSARVLKVYFEDLKGKDKDKKPLVSVKEIRLDDI